MSGLKRVLLLIATMLFGQHNSMVNADSDYNTLQYEFITTDAKLSRNDETANPNTIYDSEYLDFVIKPPNVNGSERVFNGTVHCRSVYDVIITIKKISQNGNEALFRATAHRLGRDYVECRDLENRVEGIEIVVMREQSMLDKFFPVYVSIMVILLNIVFGTEVSILDLKFLLYTPKTLIAAAICQFVLLPPYGLCLSRAMGYEPDVALGVLLVACAPGGGNSNTASYLVDGEVPLSISMTFFSTAVAIGMMPLNIWIYGRFTSSDPYFTAQSIPYRKLITALIVIAIPVAIGMLLISKAEKITKKVLRFAKPAVFCLLLIFISLAIYRSIFIFELASTSKIVGACLFPMGGFILGSVGSTVANLRLSQVKTIALEVAMQNGGIVIGMSLVLFSQPDADLNSIMPMYIMLMTSTIAVPLYIGHFILYRCNKNYRRVCIKNKEAQQLEREMFNKANKNINTTTNVKDDREAIVQNEEHENKIVTANEAAKTDQQQDHTSSSNSENDDNVNNYDEKLSIEIITSV